MRNVLVTGGAGFIGSNLCEKLLEQGFAVINLDNFNYFYNPEIKNRNISRALLNPNYKLIKGDINDRNILEEIFENHDIDIVVHLAALAGVRQSLGDPLQYIDVDIKGTVNMLEFARKYKASKFVFASSSSVYGVNKAPFKECDPVDLQISPYAAAKRAGEIYCRTYNELYGIPTVCLRFFTVYGPRQRPEMAIHSFVHLISEDCDVPIFGDGLSSRDYTYIDDIVNGIIASIDYSCNYEIFNLGNSKIVNLNELVNLIELKLGKTAKRIYLPSQQGDVDFTYADISKPVRLLGFEPKVGIEEGLERFIKWYKAIR